MNPNQTLETLRVELKAQVDNLAEKLQADTSNWFLVGSSISAEINTLKNLIDHKIDAVITALEQP